MIDSNTRARRDPVSFEFEGRMLTARRGDSVAAALLANGQRYLRTTAITGTRRGPWCMMGLCFECLVEIDGSIDQQACMIEIRAGMRIRRQRRATSSDAGLATGSHTDESR